MKHLLAGLALAFAVTGCAPVGGAPLVSSPAATVATIRTEAGAEAVLNAAEDLWLRHAADLPADRRAQAKPLVHRIPALRRALRKAQALGQADSLTAQIAEAVGLARTVSDLINGAPAAPAVAPPT